MGVKSYVSKLTRARSREFQRVFVAAFERVVELSWIVTGKLHTKVPDFFKDLLRQPPIGGCSHRKGMGPYKNPKTEFGSTVHATDYDVYLHTFPNGSRRIHCRRCGDNWFPNLPGWDQAMKMTQQSTNRESASEQVHTLTREQQQIFREKLRENPVVTCFDDLFSKDAEITEENIDEENRL